MPVWGLAGAVALIGVFVAVLLVGQPPHTSAADPQRTPRVPAAVGVEAKPTDEAIAVSLLSDSHAFNAGSWWRQTMETGMPGLTIGAWESQPGASAEVLADRLDAATARGGLVVVQAGTNDLMSGFDADGAYRNIVALWDGIEQRGATPVAALVPPSDARGDQVDRLNTLITEGAGDRGLYVIDVYSDVATEDGTWAPGLSADGIHSNDDGSALMAEAARGQLESLAAR